MKIDNFTQVPLMIRFIDDNPDKLDEKTKKTHLSLEELQHAIRYNLELLLNSRAKIIFPELITGEVVTSVMNYGIQDFTHTYFGHRKAQDKMCEIITQMIQHFEQRLDNISVKIIDNEEEERTLQLRIEADIIYGSQPKATIFESSLDLNRQRFMFN